MCGLPVGGGLIAELQVSYNTPLIICVILFLNSFPLDGLAKKFGLTPEQFGENLRDSYQRHETEQFPAEPLELAKDYVCRSVCGDPHRGLVGGRGKDLVVFSHPKTVLPFFFFLLLVNSQAQKLFWKEHGTW